MFSYNITGNVGITGQMIHVTLTFVDHGFTSKYQT